MQGISLVFPWANRDFSMGYGRLRPKKISSLHFCAATCRLGLQWALANEVELAAEQPLARGDLQKGHLAKLPRIPLFRKILYALIASAVGRVGQSLTLPPERECRERAESGRWPNGGIGWDSRRTFAAMECLMSVPPNVPIHAPISLVG